MRTYIYSTHQKKTSLHDDYPRDEISNLEEQYNVIVAEYPGYGGLGKGACEYQECVDIMVDIVSEVNDKYANIKGKAPIEIHGTSLGGVIALDVALKIQEQKQLSHIDITKIQINDIENATKKIKLNEKCKHTAFKDIPIFEKKGDTLEQRNNANEKTHRKNRNQTKRNIF